MTNRWLVVSLASVLAAVSSIAAFSAPSNAQAIAPSGPAMLHASASPPVLAHSLALGALASSADVHIDITLKLPDPSAVTAFIASLSDRHSANFHHFLRPGQFGQLFGPPLSEVAAVDAVLRSDGLHPGLVASDHLSIPVTAPVSVIDHAFHVSLVRYRLPNGQLVFTTLSPPRISRAVAPEVDGVIGLSDLTTPQSLLARAGIVYVRSHSTSDVHPSTAGPTPCSDASSAASYYGTKTADQLASYYAMSPLYSLGDFGQGVHVALVEFEPNSPSDIAEYQQCYGTNATVNYIPVDGGVLPGAGSGEAALDIEDVIGLAPEATIDVYQEPNGGEQDSYDVYSAIVNDDADNVVSISWGECELDEGISTVQSESALFAQANSQGQTVFSSSGDNGSTDCYGDQNTTNGSIPSVDDPASQPYVLGVGGTSIGTNSETVWNDSSNADGAGGGGVSQAFCMPSYQDESGIPGLVSTYSETDPTACGTTDPYLRQVPDVSADADPATGYTIYYTGTGQDFTGWGPIGGTSAAAPLWAAVAALIDASPFCSEYGSNVGGDAGVLPEGLYTLAGSRWYSSVLYDVTSDNNDYTSSGYSGGLYPATTGYDMASGLGTPIVSGFVGTPFASAPSTYYPGLAALMCSAYGTKLTTTHATSVSPSEGPASTAATVAVKGSGFLPIAGADMAEVGTSWVTAACPSTTECTVRLPAHAAGSVDIRISAEDLTLSPAAASDRYTFAAPPTVDGVTPTVGPKTGGTKVTLRGSNFVGTVSVYFGAQRAEGVHVLSASEISATAPPRPGLVYVTVAAAGGSSKKTATSIFTFVGAPTVTKVTPDTGPKTGGTKVTIRGTNFVGTVLVYFGAQKATGVRVFSSSKITATAPPRPGVVYVTVWAAGGSSKKTAASRYLYLTRA